MRTGGDRVPRAVAGSQVTGSLVAESQVTGISGDRISGDRISGDRISGDRISGDRISGDRIRVSEHRPFNANMIKSVLDRLSGEHPQLCTSADTPEYTRRAKNA